MSGRSETATSAHWRALGELLLPGEDLAGRRERLLALLPELARLRSGESASSSRAGPCAGPGAGPGAAAGAEGGRRPRAGAPAPGAASDRRGGRAPDAAHVRPASAEASPAVGHGSARAGARGAEPPVTPARGTGSEVCEEAEGWLGRLEREELREAHEALLAVHLGCRLPDDSFAAWRLPLERAPRAWGVLALAAARGNPAAELPGPLERPLSVAARLLEQLERELLEPDASGAPLGARDGGARRCALWRRRFEWASGGPGGLPSAPLEPGADPPELEDEACRWLDLGKVARAAAVLEAGGAAARSPSLARLQVWCGVLQGGLPSESEARLLRSVRARAPLPARLVELAQGDPRFARSLDLRPSDLAAVESGRRRRGASGQGQRGDAELCAQRARIDRLGAARAGVFALGPAGEAWCLESFAAPALRESLAGWIESADGALRDPQRAEHAVVARVERVVRHAEPRRRLGGGSGTARALLLLPIVDARQEAAGWIRLEFEHHLLPSLEAQADLVAAYREAVLGHVEARLTAEAVEPEAPLAPHPSAVASPEPLPGPQRAGLVLELLASGDPQRAALRAWVGSLSLKLGRRRWYLVRETAEGWAVLDSEGEALGDWSERLAEGRALDRARRTRTAIAFDDEGSGEALGAHAIARSGLVLPLEVVGAPGRALLLESGRRGDLGEPELQLLVAAEKRLDESLARAAFRSWHLAREGQDLCTELLHAGPVDELAALARADGVLALRGEPGSGRRCLSRWLHWLRLGDGSVARSSGRAGWSELRLDGDPERVSERLAAAAERSARDPSASGERLGRLARREAFGESAHASSRRRPASTVGWSSTLYVSGVERADEAQQRALAAGLERARAGRVRWVLGIEPERGALDRSLAPFVDRLALPLPGLAEGRAWLDDLIDLLLARAAEEQRIAAPQLDPRARALLWRQPWRGNARELERFLLKLCLLRPGRSVGAEDVEAVARAFRLKLLARLPSKRPDPRVLEAALEATRLGTGRINKTRAALYLGWDPDTLHARLAERFARRRS